jgi:hypothetical protein
MFGAGTSKRRNGQHRPARSNAISGEDLVCGLRGKTEVTPGFETARQRANALNSRFLQLKRHTGAGSFVWSSAIEDNLLISRNFTGS